MAMKRLEVVTRMATTHAASAALMVMTATEAHTVVATAEMTRAVEVLEAVAQVQALVHAALNRVEAELKVTVASTAEAALMAAAHMALSVLCSAGFALSSHQDGGKLVVRHTV